MSLKKEILSKIEHWRQQQARWAKIIHIAQQNEFHASEYLKGWERALESEESDQTSLDIESLLGGRPFPELNEALSPGSEISSENGSVPELPSVEGQSDDRPQWKLVVEYLRAHQGRARIVNVREMLWRHGRLSKKANVAYTQVTNLRNRKPEIFEGSKGEIALRNPSQQSEEELITNTRR